MIFTDKLVGTMVRLKRMQHAANDVGIVVADAGGEQLNKSMVLVHWCVSGKQEIVDADDLEVVS